MWLLRHRQCFGPIHSPAPPRTAPTPITSTRPNPTAATPRPAAQRCSHCSHASAHRCCGARRQAPITVTKRPGGGGFEVRSPWPSRGGGATVLETLPAAVAYLAEDVQQALLAPPAEGDPLPALDSFEGSLVGIAVGDMVGLGVENFDRDTCREYTAKLRAEGGLTATQMPWETRVKADPLIKTRGGKLRGR